MHEGSGQSFRLRWLGHSAASIVALWLFAWPLFQGLAVAVDDVQRLLIPVDNLWVGLKQAWQEALFRPSIVLSTFLVNRATRDAPWLAVIQSAALAMTAIPAWKLGRSARLAPGLVTVLWLLHPSVAVSLWQTDTLSQTLSATAGLWLFALATGAWRPPCRSAWWFAIVLMGLLTKETFLGWVPAAMLWEYFCQKRLGRVHVVIVAMVVAFVTLRLSIVLEQRDGIQLDSSLLTNLSTMLVGLLTFGPVHLLRLEGPASLAWWCSLMAPILHLGLLVTAALDSEKEARTAALLWATAVLVLTPVLMMDHVSELYLMGPNFLTTLALAECLAAVCRRHLRAAQASALALLLVAAWGLGSRSYHFALTWEYSRSLAHRLSHGDLQTSGRPPDGACLLPQRGHSVYVVSPLRALCVPCTEAVARAGGNPLPQDWVARIDCTGLPQRAAW